MKNRGLAVGPLEIQVQALPLILSELKETIIGTSHVYSLREAASLSFYSSSFGLLEASWNPQLYYDNFKASRMQNVDC